MLPFAHFRTAKQKQKEALTLVSLAEGPHLAIFPSIHNGGVREKEKRDGECLHLLICVFWTISPGLCRKIGASFAFDLSSPTRKSGRS